MEYTIDSKLIDERLPRQSENHLRNRFYLICEQNLFHFG